MIMNLTPHAVCVRWDEYEGGTGEDYAQGCEGITKTQRELVIPPSGAVARIRERRYVPQGSPPIGPVDYLTTVEGLPHTSPGTDYLVSLPVALLIMGTRDDLLVIGEAIRDANGQITACRALARPRRGAPFTIKDAL